MTARVKNNEKASATSADMLAAAYTAAVQQSQAVHRLKRRTPTVVSSNSENPAAIGAERGYAAVRFGFT